MTCPTCDGNAPRQPSRSPATNPQMARSRRATTARVAPSQASSVTGLAALAAQLLAIEAICGCWKLRSVLLVHVATKETTDEDQRDRRQVEAAPRPVVSRPGHRLRHVERKRGRQSASSSRASRGVRGRRRGRCAQDSTHHCRAPLALRSTIGTWRDLRLGVEIASRGVAALVPKPAFPLQLVPQHVLGPPRPQPPADEQADGDERNSAEHGHGVPLNPCHREKYGTRRSAVSYGSLSGGSLASRPSRRSRRRLSRSFRSRFMFHHVRSLPPPSRTTMTMTTISAVSGRATPPQSSGCVYWWFKFGGEGPATRNATRPPRRPALHSRTGPEGSLSRHSGVSHAGASRAAQRWWIAPAANGYAHTPTGAGFGANRTQRPHRASSAAEPKAAAA